MRDRIRDLINWFDGGEEEQDEEDEAVPLLINVLMPVVFLEWQSLPITNYMFFFVAPPSPGNNHIIVCISFTLSVSLSLCAKPHIPHVNYLSIASRKARRGEGRRRQRRRRSRNKLNDKIKLRMEIYLFYNGKHNILLDGVIMYNRICNVVLNTAYFSLKGFASFVLQFSWLNEPLH